MFRGLRTEALIVAALCGLLAINVAVGQQAVGQAPPRLQLQHDCFPPYFGYIQPPNNCTCSKSSPETAGRVQWSWHNGTLLPQLQDSSNRSATVVVESPGRYAQNVSLVCRLIGVNGTTSDQINYTTNLIYGPENPRLHGSTGPVHLCSNGSRDVTLYCDVPADTINPSPVYTAFVDGRRYGAYDKLPGKETLVDGKKTFRLEISFPVTKTGNYSVSCHVRNMYASANWSTLKEQVTVLAQAPGTHSC